MERTFIRYTGGLEDGKYPPVLYKYREWDDAFHKRLIYNREIFMTAPSKFEDKLDCVNPIRYELLNEKQTIEYSIFLQKIKYPNLSRQQHRQEARNWAKKKLFKNPVFVKKHIETTNYEYDLRRGVFSLTDEPDLEKMWFKYSKDSTGFCIGYNSRILFEHIGGGGVIEYCDQLPIIFPEPIMSFEEILYYKIYCKEKKWDFEKEYRAYCFWELPRLDNQQRKIILPKNAYNNVILGKKMPLEWKREIINAIKENIGDIPIVER